LGKAPYKRRPTVHTITTATDARSDQAFGRTFEQWLKAAGRSDSASEYDLREAWRAGESPGEYKAEAGNVTQPAQRGAYKRRTTMKDRQTAREDARKEKRREHEDDRTKLRNEVAASNVKIVGLEEKRDGAIAAIKDEKKAIDRTEKKIDGLSKKIKKLG
jgi:hypothetical protein